MKHAVTVETLNAALKAAFVEGFELGAKGILDAIEAEQSFNVIDAGDVAWRSSGTLAAQDEQSVHDVEACGIEGCQRCADYWKLKEGA